MTDILLVAVDHDMVNRVAELGDHRVVAMDRENVHGKHAGTPAESEFQPSIVFVGSGVSTDQALDYVRVVGSDHPEISIYLVADRATKRLIKAATGAGMSGVIDARIKDRALAQLLESPEGDAARPVAGPQPHQVIVVVSPKGGVGKTTTSVNVAARLAESAPGEVVVIDLDLQFGDVATVLDLEPSYTTTDAFASGADDSMRLRTLLTPHPANFYVLCGSDDPAANGRVTGDQIRKLVHLYAASFRYVIVDTPAGLHEETLASLEEATDVIVVAALDVATLRAVRREVDVLADLHLLPQRRHVVLNRADRRSGLTEGDAERIIGLPIDVVVPSSDHVVVAGNRGELAIASRKRNPVRRPFLALAARLADLTNPAGVALS
jgi:pilus assembly protein CpaE